MSTPMLEVPALETLQGPVHTYLAKMKARDILQLYDVHRWSDQSETGYQRLDDESRIHQLRTYLEECPVPVIPAILASINNGAVHFESATSGQGFGTLKIPRIPNIVTMVDGQHRLLGFQEVDSEAKELREELNKGQEIDEHRLKICEEVLDRDVPVLFVDSKKAADLLEQRKDPQVVDRKIVPEDVERTIFLVLNRTAKGVRPALKDTLQYKIYEAGIRGVPIIEQDPWRIPATRIARKLNFDGSPLKDKILLTPTRGMQRPIQLSSFVTSLRYLATDQTFLRLKPEGRAKPDPGESDEQLQYVKNYWTAVKEVVTHQVFEDSKNYLILRSIGVYSLNWLAHDVFTWCTADKTEPTVQNIKKYLRGLEEVDWNKETSHFVAFGGLNGVDRAYEEILTHLKDPRGPAEAQEIKARREKRARRA